MDNGTTPSNASLFTVNTTPKSGFRLELQTEAPPYLSPVTVSPLIYSSILACPVTQSKLFLAPPQGSSNPRRRSSTTDAHRAHPCTRPKCPVPVQPPPPPPSKSLQWGCVRAAGCRAAFRPSGPSPPQWCQRRSQVACAGIFVDYWPNLSQDRAWILPI